MPQDSPVNFECDSCGACCRTFPIFASESDSGREPRIRNEGRKLAAHLATETWSYQLYPLPFHETCCFLDSNQLCVVYPNRPDVCRAFEAGSDQCQEARLRLGIPPLRPWTVGEKAEGVS